ncbi:MAG: hypothetical protein FJX40_15410, partial [Alphaproteobacteria bacterium]|nr:hypothetical protein [Alphaproteobacteria bacterium]
MRAPIARGGARLQARRRVVSIIAKAATRRGDCVADRPQPSGSSRVWLRRRARLSRRLDQHLTRMAASPRLSHLQLARAAGVA